MKLISNWRKVVCRAWSFRLNVAAVIAAVLGAIDTAWPFFFGYLPIDPPVFGMVAGLLSLAAAIARLIPQETVSGKPSDANQ
ncbi:hypothetical protein [Mesorhizobium sp. M6A.T.Cr.TU.016.01.1.1]|uniref:DUF7940 domain-containing protein n=1 Tax=Mesorhizobium sp. M6A.T.Cr.TU.016.01.1.1 TaxID=2493677 RepID=UPI000F74CFBC|nr:hypothetical protein [Mesorhizobium sp. M6A.T.Cr.TU.016.01.1.1]AZO67710.1 hypothetical protein EJ075_24160 [Mesorhizobium sp. M6A.T.Cr.TU.016.01.1.1]